MSQYMLLCYSCRRATTPLEASLRLVHTGLCGFCGGPFLVLPPPSFGPLAPHASRLEAPAADPVKDTITAEDLKGSVTFSTRTVPGGGPAQPGTTFGVLAQSVERQPFKLEDAGSIPRTPHQPAASAPEGGRPPIPDVCPHCDMVLWDARHDQAEAASPSRAALLGLVEQWRARAEAYIARGREDEGLVIGQCCAELSALLSQEREPSEKVDG